MQAFYWPPLIGTSCGTHSMDLTMTRLRNSQGASKLVNSFIVEESSGGSNSTTTSCLGPETHSYNSNDPGNSSGNSGADSSNTNNDQSRNTNSGVLEGAIAGAIGGVMLLGALFFLFCRRKGRGDSRRGRDHTSLPNYMMPDPMMIGHADPGGPVNQTHAPSTSTFSAYATAPPSSWGSEATTTESTNATGSRVALMAQEEGKGLLVSHRTHNALQVMQHADGGGVPETPPSYGDAPKR